MSQGFYFKQKHFQIGGGPYNKRPELSSSGGRLHVDLSVEMASKTYDWFTIQRRTYNGTITGPTWRIRPGDNVTVNLVSGKLH